jgi:hypothetical protein
MRLILLHLLAELFHQICFPLSGLDGVKRSGYNRVDRHKLEYLKPMQKLNGAYYSYFNGVIGYWVRISPGLSA